MYTYNKLKGRIIEKYGSLTNFAYALGTNCACVSSKLKHTGFTQKTMVQWAELLDIRLEEFAEYFFT